MNNKWYTIFFICVGVVLGTLVTKLTAGISGLSWLAYGLDFGITTPMKLELGVINCTLGFTINLTVSVIIFVIVSVLIGRAILKK